MMAASTVAFDGRYVCDRYHGIGRHAFGLFDALTRLDPARRYLFYFDPAEPNSRFDLAPLAERPNVRLRPIRLPLYSPAEQLAWPVVLASDGAALFHTPYVVVPLLAPVKTLLTVHDLIFERFPEYMPQRHLRLIYRTLLELGTRRSAAVLTVSDATSRDLAAYYPICASKTWVIGNAVEPRFQPVNNLHSLEAVRARCGLPPRFCSPSGPVDPTRTSSS